MIRYDPTLSDLTGNFFVICTNVKICINNCSEWLEFNILHAEKFLLVCVVEQAGPSHTCCRIMKKDFLEMTFI